MDSTNGQTEVWIRVPSTERSAGDVIWYPEKGEFKYDKHSTKLIWIDPAARKTDYSYPPVHYYRQVRQETDFRQLDVNL